MRQAKVTTKTSAKKNSVKKRFNFDFLSLCAGIFIFVALVGFELFLVKPATAYQLPINTPTTALLAENLVLDPTSSSEALILPLEDSLQKPFEPIAIQEASDSAASQPEDYCVNVPVLMYHHIQPLDIADLLGHKALTVDSTMFDQQMEYLSQQGYTAISAEELTNALQTQEPLPEKSIVITIDDGYDDNYTFAFMTAKKYQMIMNFMIPTGLIGKSGYMQWDHLREMAQNPYARLYNHTTSHAALGYSTKEQVLTEVRTANEQLAAELGLENKIVTYPYGSYNDGAIADLKELGMTAAFTTDPGTTHCTSTIMQLPRVRIGNASMNFYGY